MPWRPRRGESLQHESGFRARGRSGVGWRGGADAWMRSMQNRSCTRVNLRMRQAVIVRLSLAAMWPKMHRSVVSAVCVNDARGGGYCHGKPGGSVMVWGVALIR
eukprot:5593181-Prymnesium_polylepis.1